MTITYQNKQFYVNNSKTLLTTSNGAKVANPVFYVNSDAMLNWQIIDADGNTVDLSTGAFEFIIKTNYNGATLLDVPDGSFDSSGAAIGAIKCEANFDQAAIRTFLSNSASETAQCGLWCTIGGIDYLLVAFECNLFNTIY